MTLLTTAQSPPASFGTAKDNHYEQREISSSIWNNSQNSIAAGGSGVVKVMEELQVAPMSNLLAHNSSKKALQIEMGRKLANEFRYPGFSQLLIYFTLFSVVKVVSQLTTLQ